MRTGSYDTWVGQVDMCQLCAKTAPIARTFYTGGPCDTNVCCAACVPRLETILAPLMGKENDWGGPMTPPVYFVKDVTKPFSGEKEFITAEGAMKYALTLDDGYVTCDGVVAVTVRDRRVTITRKYEDVYATMPSDGYKALLAAVPSDAPCSECGEQRELWHSGRCEMCEDSY